MPGIAQRVAKRSGLGDDVLAFDVNAACSGFVYGLIAACRCANPASPAA